jgi:hypothetical protein
VRSAIESKLCLAAPFALHPLRQTDGEQIELREFGASGIPSEYLARLPDRKMLEQKLHAAIEFVAGKVRGERR